MQLMRKSQLNIVTDNTNTEKATKILAKSLYRELKKGGFSDSDIVNFSVALVENVVSHTTEKGMTDTPRLGAQCK